MSLKIPRPLNASLAVCLYNALTLAAPAHYPLPTKRLGLSSPPPSFPHLCHRRCIALMDPLAIVLEVTAATLPRLVQTYAFGRPLAFPPAHRACEPIVKQILVKQAGLGANEVRGRGREVGGCEYR